MTCHQGRQGSGARRLDQQAGIAPQPCLRVQNFLVADQQRGQALLLHQIIANTPNLPRTQRIGRHAAHLYLRISPLAQGGVQGRRAGGFNRNDAALPLKLAQCTSHQTAATNRHKQRISAQALV